MATPSSLKAHRSLALGRALDRKGDSSAPVSAGFLLGSVPRSAWFISILGYFIPFLFSFITFRKPAAASETLRILCGDACAKFKACLDSPLVDQGPTARDG